LGFLGPNGAGKTTTMKIITSFIAPDEGNVYIGGKLLAIITMNLKSISDTYPRTILYTRICL